MQIPKRRSQVVKQQLNDDNGPVYLTPRGVENLKRTLRDLEEERPSVVADLSRAIAMGDLSENAEYTESKARLGRIDGRIFGIKERLKRVVLIEEGASDRVRIGSTVVVSVEGRQKTYRIVGPHETDPTKGRISHLSPLGSALLDHVVGDAINVPTDRGDVMYGIVEIS
jgi:transcription elongation GreA/GreB family factor